MSQATGEAIALLTVGLALSGWAVLCIRSGKSYIANPAMRASRRDDPFSFWLSVTPMLAIGIVLIGLSLVRLAFR
jgi:hypothetical protein